ncbi:MAG: hypothetical protein HY254_07900 [Burkholderiales bacterium]|nr:hypothetical protein [Burkholderiales bacterium]
MRSWLRVALFISSLSPALLGFGWGRYVINGWSVEVAQFMIISILGTLLPILVIHWLAQQGESITISVKKVESNDFILIAFLVSYVLPFFINGSQT